MIDLVKYPEDYHPLLRLLVNHRRENPIRRRSLMERAELSERAVRQMLTELVMIYGLPVCYSVQKPFGYYIAATDEDKEPTLRVLYSGAMRLLEHYAKLRDALVPGDAVQLTLTPVSSYREWRRSMLKEIADKFGIPAAIMGAHDEQDED